MLFPYFETNRLFLEMRHNRHLFPNKLLDFVSTTFICFLILLSSFVQSCQPPTPGFQQFQDSSMSMIYLKNLTHFLFLASTSYSSKCPDLILYPVNAVDTSDQYRFDYSDVSFGNTHSQGETVTISCTNSGDNTVQTVVEGYDQV